MTIGRLNSVFAVSLAVVGGLQTAHAVPISFTGAGTSGDGTKLAAKVTFDVNISNQLVVTLQNIAEDDPMTMGNDADVGAANEVLTAVFFNIDGAPTLTRFSAFIGGGSVVQNNTAASGGPTGPSSGQVGGEWAYKGGGTLNGVTQNQGISSAGLNDIFGPGDRFPGNDLQGPPSGSPNGVQYGIVPADDNRLTVNGSTNGQWLINDMVTFILGGLPMGFSLDDINSIRFQYGTGLNEPSLTGVPGPGIAVPLPSNLALLSAGLATLAWVRRR